MSGKQPPSSLDGLIQPKGAARPDTMQQRGAPTPPTPPVPPVPPAATPVPDLAPAPAPVAPAAPARGPEPRSKALTLRLSETQYQRLRRFAFDRGLSHQDVIERALLDHLDAAESQ